MASTTFVRAGIDEDLKTDAAAVPADKIPNAETRAAMEETRALAKARGARFSNAQEAFDALDEEAS